MLIFVILICFCVINTTVFDERNNELKIKNKTIPHKVLLEILAKHRNHRTTDTTCTKQEHKATE